MKTFLTSITLISIISSAVPLVGCGGGGGSSAAAAPQTCCQGTNYQYQTQTFTKYPVRIGSADDRGMICTADRAFFACN